MAAFNDFELLTACANVALESARRIEAQIIAELEHSARTSLVNGLRVFKLQRAILATGMFSMFESFLQDHMKWDNAFENLPRHLESKGEANLAEQFAEYRDATNVLKHGRGRSYEKLLLKRDHLEFRIRAKDEPFFEEGDVAEVNTLIEVDDAFVQRCAEIIQEITGKLPRQW